MEKPSVKFPEDSGVYTFWQEKRPIYIGKAINLKNRLNSYFNLHLLPKTRRMVNEASEITYVKVASEFESLLLEAKLIHKFQPKYNVIAKDDKNPLYITITNDEYPRVITTRKTGSFGPFPSSTNVKSVLKMIRRIFPYSDHKIGKKACLYSQIGLCNPCPNNIASRSDRQIYLGNIRQIRAILNGKLESVKVNLVKKMSKLARENKFEEAIEVRSKINKLDYITRPRISVDEYLENPNLLEDIRLNELTELRNILLNNNVNVKKLNRIECYDIAHLSGSFPTASMIVFTNGTADKAEYRHFKIRQNKSNSDYDSICEIATRRARQEWPEPDLIIVDGGLGQVKAFNSVHPTIGIAKNPDRLIIGQEKIRLTGNLLRLIERIRDEAHRFARKYHHQLLLNSLTK